MSLPVISVEQMRRWEEATWESSKTEEEVIAQVGEVVAARVVELTRPGDAILLLAGKGHNGDDVRAVANHLPEREMSLLSVIDPAKTRQKLPLDLDPAPALVVDGLFHPGPFRPKSEAHRRHENTLGNLSGSDHFSRIVTGASHGFLAQNMLARSQRGEGLLAM